MKNLVFFSYNHSMKEIIEYNYNIVINDYSDDNNIISFYYDDFCYIFVNCNRDLKEIDEILKYTRDLNGRGIKTLDFIYNRYNKVITQYNGVNYILFKVMDKPYRVVDFMEMLDDNNKTRDTLKIVSWKELWIKKIDYYEYQVNQLGRNKKIITETFSYYVGLAENAIELVNLTEKKYKISNLDICCLNHRRIFNPNYALNYYNPLGFIIDLEVRDVAEYLKSSFFAGQDSLSELKTYLKFRHLSIYGYQLLLARLLFPTYYFDIYDKIMNENENPEKLLKIIEKNQEFENFIKKAYQEILKYANIEKIEWLT